MKYVVLRLDGEEYFVRCPRLASISHRALVDAVQSIRVDGPGRTWRREFRDSEVVSAGIVEPDGTCSGGSQSLGLSSRSEDSALVKQGQKYVVLSVEGEEFLFGFQKCTKMTHKAMAETLRHLRADFDGKGPEREFMLSDVVSAGFITPDGFCHDRSESLGIDSRPEDTGLLSSSYNPAS